MAGCGTPYGRCVSAGGFRLTVGWPLVENAKKQMLSDEVAMWSLGFAVG
ncbi:MAG: hypothetical protein QOG98_721, partial [Pseudonocardiales bacterium]|nr:hypothetical protein [Pseudonocardiales bacterium]